MTTWARSLALAVFASFAGFTTYQVWAQPSPLDPAFGEGGRVWTGPVYEGSGPKLARVVATQDGGVLVATETRLDRYDASGHPDPTFGYGDAGVAGTPLPQGIGVHSIGRPALRPDGSMLVPALVHSLPTPWWNRMAVVKLRADGKRDVNYGVDGVAFVDLAVEPPPLANAVLGIAVEPDGRAIVAGVGREGTLELARFLPSGRVDESFGPNGLRRIDGPSVEANFRFEPARDGGFAVPFAIREWGVDVGVARFRPGGEPETTFGPTRLITQQPLDEVLFASALIDRDGSVLVVAGGYNWCHVGGCNYTEVMARLAPSGEAVTEFGDGGRVVRNDYDVPEGGGPWVESAEPPWYVRVEGLATDAEGGIVLLGGRETVHRLDARGKPDARFSNGGEASVPEPFGLSSQALAVGENGTAYVAAGVAQAGDLWVGGPPGPWRMALYRVRPNWEAGGSDATVVEYFHEGFGHYFATPYPAEQQTLDASVDWRRTGLGFRAWTAATPNVWSVCRFYSHSMFAPKSTHFYTHVEPECRALRSAGQWEYEGPTFAVRLLEGSLERRCPTGAVALYRLYNNGQGGAPNHRYTTDVAVVDAMIVQGWTPEGEGGRGFFACVAER